MNSIRELVNQNRKKIEKFDLNYQISHKNFEIACAVAALETTNLVSQSYFEDEANLDKGDYVLRLYALLQALFVSIDSLYAMSYSITSSKNFININSNPKLRRLKYIRNDVVGHPANRSKNKHKDRGNSYCILDNDSVTKEAFTYYIYSSDGSCEKETINIGDLVSSYYKESISFLDVLYQVSSKFNQSSVLKESIAEVLDRYYKTGHFRDELYTFIDRYKAEYRNHKRENNRIIWRYELVLKLMDVSNDNSDIMDVIKYSIGIELNKMYKMLWGKDYSHKADFELPSMVLSAYRFFNRNPEYIPYIKHLKDIDDPLFFKSLKEVYEGASVKKMQNLMDYLGFIITLYYGQQWDLIYSITLPILEYKKKEK